MIRVTDPESGTEGSSTGSRGAGGLTQWGVTTVRVLGLEQGIGETDEALRGRALERAGVAEEALRGFRIAHRALDARRRRGERQLRFVVHVDLLLHPNHHRDAGPTFQRALRAGRIRIQPPDGRFEVDRGAGPAPSGRVAVVGAGPGGLFAALVLARNGIEVDLIDRGAELRERSRTHARFLRTRELDPECNLLYGEGGAGTYSDGKIYTRTDHPLEMPILQELIACGAPKEIAFDARAHIGTDRLHRILPRLRQRMASAGVCFHWRTRLEGLVRAGDRVRALRTSAGELACDAVVLAPGHSARDTLRALHAEGLAMTSKPFQLGVRIEHPQRLIDAGRYGDADLAHRLGAAYYGLVNKGSKAGPGAHTFCMCPGGQIVASVDRAGMLCTNGMSNSRHSSPWANAAMVTTLGPREFGEGVFAGVELQERLERALFEAGGSDYTAPAQRAPDFLAERESRGELRSSYGFGLCGGRIDRLLPESVREPLHRALRRFEGQIPGYAGEQGLLVGIETRSSGPIRIPRHTGGRSVPDCENLYPVGEGAGYAGGIMSAAIDGARSAQAIVERLSEGT